MTNEKQEMIEVEGRDKELADMYMQIEQSEQDENKIEVDPLEVIKNNVEKRGGYEGDEYLDVNITRDLMESLMSQIKHGNLIKILVRGDTTSGKSTLGLYLVNFLNKMLEREYNKTINMNEVIFSDQIEANRGFANGKEHTAILIDEFSAVGEGDANSTTERQTFTFYNDVCAQRYIHRVMCAPRMNTIYDNNANIILDVIGRNDELYRTSVKVVYKNPTDQMNFVLGIAHFYVKDVLEMDWYKHYRTKKFARISLLDKYGVRDIRELENANLVIEAYNRLKDVVRKGANVNQGTIRSVVKGILNDNKILFSIIAMHFVVQDISDLLQIEKDRCKIEEKLLKPMAEDKMKRLTEAKIELDKVMKNTLDGMTKYSEILKEYLKIT